MIPDLAQVPVKPVEVEICILFGIPETFPSMPFAIPHDELHKRRTGPARSINKRLRLLNRNNFIGISMNDQRGW